MSRLEPRLGTYDPDRNGAKVIGLVAVAASGALVGAVVGFWVGMFWS